jgi:dTDP-4-amino-4,6-dideoxygalactose transaminase
MILCADPRAQYLAHKAAIDAAVQRVLERGRYILGDEVGGFEADFAVWVGAKFAIGVGNGTEALHLALVAAGVERGDEVITVSHTAVATVAGVELAGAVPVLVDIDPDTFTMDPAQVEAAITSRTRAIIPVHLYGQPADLDAIGAIARRRGLTLIEDCAQSTGAAWNGRRTGSIGAAGCFSFYPTKNLGAIGDGGMLVTSDPEIARRARQLREYGWNAQRVCELPGWNSRLDELQAAILRVKLAHLDADNTARRRIAARYDAGLRDLGVTVPAVRPGGDHVYHLYVLRSPDRDRLKARLEQRGVAPGIHYAVPAHLHPAYRGRVRTAGELPESERAATTVLSLPMYPELTDAQADEVIAAVRAAHAEAP